MSVLSAGASGSPDRAEPGDGPRRVLADLPVLLFGFDRNGVCNLSEGGLLPSFGFEPGSNVGLDVSDLQDRFPELVEPIGRCLQGEVVLSYLEIDGYDRPFELRWSPTRDREGEITGLIAVTTESPVAVDTSGVHQVRAEYRALLAAFPDHVLRYADGELVTVKLPKAGTATCPDPCWVPHPVEELLPWDAAARLLEATEVVLDSGDDQVVEYGHEDVNRPERFEARVLRESDDRALVIVREVTHRHRMENELREATKLEALGRLAAGVAHEINTPVQFVSHNVEFMGRAFDSMHQLLVAYRRALSPGDPRPWMERADELAQAEKLHDVDFLLSEVPPAVDEALDGMRRVTTIVQAMRVFSHPAAREMSSADINDAVRNAVVVSTSQHKHIAVVELDLGNDLPPVRCVIGEVAQVLLNLIGNAAQAIEASAADREGPGTIRLSTRQEGESIVITIGDDGHGIDPTDQSRVFDPFFTTKEVGSGTGQGLTLVRTIVVGKHGGQIALRSAPGEGATFEVRLPIDGPPIEEGA